MTTDKDIEKFKKHLKILSLQELVELKKETVIFMPKYELKIKLINNEMKIREQRVIILKRKRRKIDCEITLLKYDIDYPFNEN
jgi:hypothetical protein